MKQFFITLICLIPIILYFSLPHKTENNVILILGNSLSFAYGVDNEKSWVSLLQHRLDNQKYPYKVINFSIPGDTTENGLKRLPWALKVYRPKITIIELGANDGINGYPFDTIKNNLTKIIVLAKAANSKVILLGIHLPPNYGDLGKIAKEQDVGFVPHFLRGVGENPQLMQKDKLHPTEEAQPILLETIWPELKKTLNQIKARS